MRAYLGGWSASLRRQWKKLALVGVWLGVASAGYFWGRSDTVAQVNAAPSGKVPVQEVSATAPTVHRDPGRPVAYIHGNIAITREDLGEFLIARYGKDKINHLINRRIIEHAASAKGLDLTEAEVNAAIAVDAAQLNVSVKEFDRLILKRYQKTLFEWKEDVVKPRLLLEKLSKGRVTVTREDLAMAFEAYYGEKVQCKMIMWPRDQEKIVHNQIWPSIRNDEKEFDHQARIQPSPSLAATGGEVKPIGRNTIGDAKLEKVLFELRPGEVSPPLNHPEGIVVVKCLGRIPPDTSVNYDKVRPELEKEVFDKKVSMEVTRIFAELRAEAKPQNLMDATPTTDAVQKEFTPPPIKPASMRPLPSAAFGSEEK